MRTNQDHQDKRNASSGRLHGYVRVSTREQASDNRLSLSIQEQEIRELARSRYPERELILWSDPAQSAWSIPLARRKAGKAMLEALQPGDIIVSSKFDRLFRSMQDTHNQIAEFQMSGIELIILQFGPQPIGETPMGKAMVSLFALIGEMEGDFIRQRTADGKAAKVARGGFVGGAVPIGKRKIGKGREAYLVDDERELEMLRAARDLAAQGETPPEIAEKLNRLDYRSRKGTPITRTRVYEWIRRDRDRTRRETPSERIRQGLAKRKEKGLPLGNPRIRAVSALGVATVKARSATFRQGIIPIIEQICAADPLNVTLQSISNELTRQGIPTQRGGEWHPATVRNLLQKEGKSLPHPRYRPDESIMPLQDRVHNNDRDPIGLSQGTVTDDQRIHELKEMMPKLFLLKKRGWSSRKLSREFGIARRTLERQFSKQRQIWALMGREAKKETIIVLGEAGWTRQEIMDELHVSQRTVYRHLPTSRHAALCASQQPEPQVARLIAPDDDSVMIELRTTSETQTATTNNKPTDHHSKKTSDQRFDGIRSKIETRQLSFAFADMRA